MTGFATLRGQSDGASWVWEIRSVNARGLDIRCRVPDWIDGLERAVRAAISSAVGRGNVSLSLKFQRDDAGSALQVNPVQLDRVLAAVSVVENAAADANIALAKTSAVDILMQRGVLEMASTEQDSAPVLRALLAEMPGLLADFNTMRANEGHVLCDVLRGQLDRLETLVNAAERAAIARRDAQAAGLRANLARVLENSDGADENRVAQELALLAVKTDITEELDRLGGHIAAARSLLLATVPVGRKLDFLMQEFNREANTLCSKAQSADLTRIGLDLKATIDQMREQVQNVE